jgi:spore germination protein GerM
MQKNQGISHLLAISLILFLAIVTSGGVYYFKTHSINNNSQLVSAPSETPSPTSSPTTEPSPEPTLTPSSPNKMVIKVYFGNSKLNKENDCSQVYPVVREIPKTQAVAKAALNELFAGPTQVETNEGATSFFSSKTKSILKSVKIEEETAYVDLVDIRQTLSNASTSCGSVAFLAEVENTLKQFGTVKKVVIAINGKPETFYEWIQVGCPVEGDLCNIEPFE